MPEVFLRVPREQSNEGVGRLFTTAFLRTNPLTGLRQTLTSAGLDVSRRVTLPLSTICER
jgi:hypothetical protein